MGGYDENGMRKANDNGRDDDEDEVGGGQVQDEVDDWGKQPFHADVYFGKLGQLHHLGIMIIKYPLQERKSAGKEAHFIFWFTSSSVESLICLILKDRY